jgi:peroxiredoxin
MPTVGSMSGHALGWQAAPFELEGVDGRRYSLEAVRGPKGTVVMFICNHCPYVKAVIADVVREMAQLKAEGVGAIAVMSNDTANYPADSFDNMKAFAAQHGFGFPYVIDRTQGVAKAYDAVCTPEFFGFDKDLKLQYHGRIAEMRGTSPVRGARRELLEAMRAVAAGKPVPQDQEPAMGCSIKWKH